MVMNREDMMARMSSPAPEKEAPTAEPTFDTTTVMSNYEAMPDEEKQIVQTLLQDPIPDLLDSLLGEPVMQQVSQQIGQPSTERPAAPTPSAPAKEGIMAPSEDTAPKVSMSEGGTLGKKFGTTSPENKKLIQLYKEDKLSLQGMRELARDIDSRRLSADESATPSKEEMEVFYDMAYEYGEEELFPEKYSEKPAMAMGGAITSQMKEMARQGMSPTAVRSRIK